MMPYSRPKEDRGRLHGCGEAQSRVSGRLPSLPTSMPPAQNEPFLSNGCLAIPMLLCSTFNCAVVTLEAPWHSMSMSCLHPKEF